jgi:transposase
MSESVDLNKLSHLQLQELAEALLNQLSAKDSIIQSKNQELQFRQAKIDKLTHEIAVLRRLKFAASSERLANEQQASLLDEAIDADLAAIEVELEALRQRGAPTSPNDQANSPHTPRRTPLPAHLPRTVLRHEPDSTQCGCGAALERMGEDVSERLDYTPGVFSVERHVRGKWVCRCCQTLVQAPVPAHVIDKGLPTTALLADVLVGKYAEHLPLYRQESIYARAGVPIARSTLSAWVGQCGVALQPLTDALARVVLAHAVLHADETPVQMLKPGSGKTHRAYIWAYATGAFEPLRAVVYDFCTSRGGLHAREFLGQWKGQLVCDDYSAYKDLFRNGVTEVGCLAHARRKFFELHEASKSTLAATALEFIQKVYEVERLVRDASPAQRLQARQHTSRPVMDAWHEWMTLQRVKLTDSSATAKAFDYSLKRWAALTRFLDDPALPVDNNHIENLIRPITLGRRNWLFAGSERAGQRAAAIMSLIQSARLNGLDPYAYLKDVMDRLPTQRDSEIDDLLPHNWKPRPAAG